MSILKLWGSLGKLFKPFVVRLAMLNCFSFIQAVAQVAFAVVTKYVVDAALENNGKLVFWGLTLIGVLVLMVVNYAVYSWYAESTRDKCMAHMRYELLAAAAKSEEERLQAYHSGELLSRGMDDVYTVCSGAVSALPTLVGQIARLVGAFVSVMAMYPPIAPLFLAAGAAMVLASASIKPITKKRQAKVRLTEEQVMAGMQEDLQQLELIKSLQAEEKILERFSRLLKKSLKAMRKRRIWSVGSSSFITAVSQFGTGALLLWGAGQVAVGSLSYGSLTAMTQLLTLFRGPVVGLSGQFTKIASIEVAGERLLELLKTPENAPAVKQEDVQVEAVVFENVTFSYPGDEAPVVSDFNASFPLDKWACLTGISGKGKSTLFKLMLGLYTPQQGRVYLRTDKGKIPCGMATRHLFAYVPQDFALFSGTILDNMLLVAPDADEAKCRQALEIADASYVWELAHQEQTQLKENNTGLSKGQIQRLAIARAVLMERPIFLLDECTSALDAQTEANVLSNLQKLGKQAILVTHRPEAVAELEKVTYVSMEE